ncbi:MULTISPECIES: hypothetical protein, partial [unclassified Clostridium]|uniref:hypothetical protein n=1 Tax=unclassified Clostridium TaxID=2614128 RepID=UPI001A9BFB9A
CLGAFALLTACGVCVRQMLAPGNGFICFVIPSVSEGTKRAPPVEIYSARAQWAKKGTMISVSVS